MGLATTGSFLYSFVFQDDHNILPWKEDLLLISNYQLKEESEKVDLKLNIQKTKIMASGPITSWEIDGEAVETMSDFIFLGSRITADSDCSHEMKRRLLLGRKIMTNLDSLLKSRDINYFVNKGLSSQGYGFSSGHVWMWELDCEESWAPKNWCLWMWCWRRLLRVPWTARSNQSILKEVSPGCSLEGLMLKLKLQYFGHLMEELTHLKRPWCWERLRAVGEEDDRGWDGWWWALRVDDGQGGLACCSSWGCRVRHDWTTELNYQLRNHSIEETLHYKLLSNDPQCVI